ncbi:hypothetical protein C0992_009410 [Termitomyces sp. T32_za158]|nr:hypothetical protein C0992_009410 [Termitomyces sp. T32_za158]
MEEQEVEASSDTELSLQVKAKDQGIRSEILKIKIRKPLKSGAAKIGGQVSIAKHKTEIVSESESESKQSDSMHCRAKKKKLQSKDDTLMEVSGSVVKRGQGQPQKAKDTLLTIEVVQRLDASVYVNLGMPPKLVRGCTYKGDKLEPQKPKQYGPFTLTANMPWTRFLTEVLATVDIKLENLDLTEMTWCFQKKAQLMLTSVGVYKAMIQQILALKNPLAAIIIVSLPTPKCAHTKSGQKYQQESDEDFEELNQLDENTKWGKKVS